VEKSPENSDYSNLGGFGTSLRIFSMQSEELFDFSILVNITSPVQIHLPGDFNSSIMWGEYGMVR